MKLIDILVEELPKRGGWPAEALFAMQDYEGLVKFSKSREKIYHDYSSGHVWCSEGGYGWITNGYPFEGCFKVRVAKDSATAFISREQYEAALVAIKQEWNGEGMPPVGCKCEWQNKNTKQWVEVLVVYASEWVTVIRENKTVDPVELAIENYGDDARCQFRPIRSEADKKRDEVGEAIYRAINWNHEGTVERNSRFEDYCKVYDAIAAGKIPHIRIE